jgi:energy-coupling factor transporter ATP-binding protein EcfA2
MKQIKLKKGQTLGALAAETDSILEKVFVDTGYVDVLNNTSDPHFLIIGRTGSGKTALIRYIKKYSEHNSNLDPDELSMQYLHSNPILKTIVSWGVHLDIFFKFLWRHICVLELIKMRYQDIEGSVSVIDKVKGWLFSNEKKTQNLALQYLENHGQEYWITADTHIKAFTSELESKISNDRSIGAKIGKSPLVLNFGDADKQQEKIKERVEVEVKNRVQAIVNDYQVAALNEVVTNMSKNSFNDPKRRYFLIIDDLDKNWMPDDLLYLELLKSLLYTVKELNQKLEGVKIIVAMRTNIYFRLFKKTRQSEPQREKWIDVLTEIRWSKADLCEFINKRLSEVFRDQYTKEPPTIVDILPQPRKRRKEETIDYILERTFYRPRDVLAFFNTCFELSDGMLNLTWSKIEKAEEEYSKQRLNSIIDEWKDSYFGLPALFPMLPRLGEKFELSSILDTDIDKIFSHKMVTECPWLTFLQDQYCNDRMSFNEIKYEFLNVLYLIGIVGFKQKGDNKVVYSFEQPLDMTSHVKNFPESTIHVHKMFWKAFEINAKS